MNKIILITLMLFSGFVHSNPDEKMRAILATTFGESEIYERFFYQLKSALTSGNKEKVADLTGYPIRVNFDVGTEYFNSKEQFLANYSRVVTDEMLTRVKQQKFSELFANWSGINIGYGDIWFGGNCVGTVPNKGCDTVVIKVHAYNVNNIGAK